MLRSLRSLLSLSLSGLVLLPLVVVVGLTLLIILPKMSAQVEAENRALSNSTTARIESLLFERAQESRQLAAQIAALPDHDPRVMLMADVYAGSEEAVEAVFVLDPELRVIQVGLPLMQRRFRSDYIGVDFSGYAYARKALRTGQTVWSEVYLSMRGKLVVAVAIPVDKRIYVTKIDLMHLSSFVKKLGEQSGAMAIILDRHLHLVAHPNLARSMQHEGWENNPLFRRGWKEKTATGEIMLDGVKHIGTVASISQLGWLTLVAKPKAAAYQVFYVFSYWLLFISALVFCLVLLLALGVANFVSQRLEVFGRQLAAIANGDYSKNLSHFRVKELNVLTDHVQQMADAVLERELQLRESEAKYREVIENSRDLICRVDTDGILTFSNNRSQRYFGLPPEECVGKSVFDFSPPDDLPRVRPEFDNWVKSGVLSDYIDGRVINKSSGEEFLLRWRVVAVRGEHGEIEGVTGIGRNITEERRAESELRLAASVFESSVFGIVITNPNLNIISVNPAMTDITGYTSEEILGKNPSIFKSGIHTSDFYDEMWQALKADGLWGDEVWNRRRNGEIFPAWLRIKAVENPDGTIANYIGTCVDITDQKRAEEQIRFLAHHDALTGLPNRMLLDDRLQRAIAQSKRVNMRAAVMFLDLDRFKWINDTLGHETGDKLLQAVSSRLKALLRETDTVSRFGGDEFVVVVPEIEGEEQASMIAQKILDRFSEPHIINDEELHVSTSIGISLYPDNGQDAKSILKKADIAMYASKAQGRNNYQLFRPEMEDTVTKLQT